MHRRRRPMAGRGVRAGAGVRRPPGGGRARGASWSRCATPPTTATSAPTAGLPELRLAGLGDSDARALLATAVRTPLDELVRDRIVAEARGNPLALLELPRSASPARLAGGFERPDAMSVPRRIEDMFKRRSGDLPAETQLLLLVAAAEPTGDAELLWRAAADLGISHESAAPAEVAGLREGRRARVVPTSAGALRGLPVRHPPDRRRAHRALAGATDRHRDPDRRAWHSAQAVLGRRRGGRRPSWSGPPDGRARAAVWPPRRRSSSGPPSSPPSPPSVRGGRWTRPTPSTRPERPSPPWSC